MGNGCICYTNICYQEMKVDNYIEEQNRPTESNLYNNLAKYFNEYEKDINKKIEKKHIKKIFSFKKYKNLNTLYSMGNSKYELMLKRLSEQKKIERKGPKRRETIRNNNNDFIKIIYEAIEDNKKIKYKNENDSKKLQKKESILLNNKDKFNSLYIQSGKHSLIVGKFSKKKIVDNLEEI